MWTTCCLVTRTTSAALSPPVYRSSESCPRLHRLPLLPRGLHVTGTATYITQDNIHQGDDCEF